jgi:hypothetical protein
MLKMSPGGLTGKVLYPDGKTPVAKAPVRVWSVEEKKFICQAVTDDQGAYELPRLEPGCYVVVFGDRARVELLVADDAKRPAEPLNVLIPHGKVFFYPAQVARELAAGSAPGAPGGFVGKLLTTKVLLLGGATTAVASVATKQVYDHNKSHHHRVVSP